MGYPPFTFFSIITYIIPNIYYSVYFLKSSIKLFLNFFSHSHPLNKTLFPQILNVAFNFDFYNFAFFFSSTIFVKCSHLIGLGYVEE